MSTWIERLRMNDRDFHLAGMTWWSFQWRPTELCLHVRKDEDLWMYKVCECGDGFEWDVAIKIDDTSKPDDSFYVFRRGKAETAEAAAQTALAVTLERKQAHGLVWFSARQDCWSALHDEESIEIVNRAYEWDVMTWGWSREHRAADPLAKLFATSRHFNGRCISLDEAMATAASLPATIATTCRQVVAETNQKPCLSGEMLWRAKDMHSELQDLCIAQGLDHPSTKVLQSAIRLLREFSTESLPEIVTSFPLSVYAAQSEER